MATPRRLRILMLHGYTQSGPLFHAKTRALEKNLHKAFPAPTYAVSLEYPTAPVRIQPADIPDFTSSTTSSSSSSHARSNGTADSAAHRQPYSAKDADGNDPSTSDAWGWWVRRGDGEPYTYAQMETGLATVAEHLRASGPFDGVIGFSQGGALAGMVASLLEPGRRDAFERCQSKGGMAFPASFEEDTGYVTDVIHPPLSFAVSYSGFGADANNLYTAYYDPKIQTPMLHFLGSVDTVVEESRSMRLVAGTEEGEGVGGKRVVRHPGGHFLPSSQKQYVAALVGFIKEVMGWEEGVGVGAGRSTGGSKAKKDEDLDNFPF